MDADYWEKRASKSEWIHNEYVKMYEPYHEKYGTGRLPDNAVSKLKSEIDRINKSADEKFGKF